MHNQCSGGQCGLPSSCGCGDSCGCGSSCGYESRCTCGCGMQGNCPGGDLMELVKGAKACLLKDKIKQRLEAKIGKHLDAKADMAVDMMLAMWEMKKEKHQKKQEWMEKMQAVMGQ